MREGCKECYFIEDDKCECEMTGHCPLETTEKELSEMRKAMSDIFNDMHSVGVKKQIIKEYRALYRINDAMGTQPFESILAVIEDCLPAFDFEHIHDDNNDMNDRYYELIGKAIDWSVSDEDFYREVMRE